MTFRRFLLTLLALVVLAEAADLAWLRAGRATITSTASKVVGAGNGSTTQWNFGFVGVSAADLVVTYTDAGGNSTVLTLNSQYSVTFTPIPPNGVWALGGFVTYPLSGPPIALGTTLTIARQVPLVQPTPFQNQGQFLPQAVEIGLDLLTMQVQQLATLFNGALVEPATDSQPLAPLPAAASRANNALCFDSTGYNPVACATPATGIISTAMQPVVDAASLGAGRTAFGLGSMAQENIAGGTCGGASIQDDGSGGGANGTGFARVVEATAPDAANTTVTCAMHLTYRIASGPFAYTLGRASTTYFNGFTFTVNATVGVITVTPNSNDLFNGSSSGTAISIPQGMTCRITTNAAANATWYADCAGSAPTLQASATGGALTLSLYAARLNFRDPTLAQGDALWAQPAGALTVTVPSGATLGTTSGAPFRVWIFAAYHGGTPILGVATCSAPGAIYACAAWETLSTSWFAITAGSTTAGELYTSAATSADSVRIIGYAEYASGLATAGTWASVPTTLQICLPPFACKRPGDVVVTTSMSTSSGTSTTGTAFVTSAIALTAQVASSANLMRVTAYGSVEELGTSGMTSVIYRGATAISQNQTAGSGTSGSFYPLAFGAILDLPGGNAVYAVYFKSLTSGQGVEVLTGGITVDEIMGALDAPANDNGSFALRMVG
jgi:hypothetical protein